MDLHIDFPDIDDLYREAHTLEPEGNEEAWEFTKRRCDKNFRGLITEDILKYKYGYTPGIEKLEELDQSFILGSSRFKYKWNEDDGDEMDMLRAYEGMPYLKKRHRTVGNGTGKFVTIHVNTGELAYVGYEKMLKKAYTVGQIVNKLEATGFRTQVLVDVLTRGAGWLKGDYIDLLRVTCPIKKFTDPLNMALILNCISPWFHRYWMFMVRAAKFKCADGMGSSTTHHKEDTPKDIWIDTGQCLTDSAVEDKLQSIEKMMNKQLEGV